MFGFKCGGLAVTAPYRLNADGSVNLGVLGALLAARHMFGKSLAPVGGNACVKAAVLTTQNIYVVHNYL